MSENCKYCNAEMKISKKGNLYCTNICWEKEPYKTQRNLDQLDYEGFIDSKHGDWGDR